jgi:hypothetical protein
MPITPAKNSAVSGPQAGISRKNDVDDAEKKQHIQDDDPSQSPRLIHTKIGVDKAKSAVGMSEVSHKGKKQWGEKRHSSGKKQSRSGGPTTSLLKAKHKSTHVPTGSAEATTANEMDTNKQRNKYKQSSNAISPRKVREASSKYANSFVRRILGSAHHAASKKKNPPMINIAKGAEKRNANIRMIIDPTTEETRQDSRSATEEGGRLVLTTSFSRDNDEVSCITIDDGSLHGDHPSSTSNNLTVNDNPQIKKAFNVERSDSSCSGVGVQSSAGGRPPKATPPPSTKAPPRHVEVTIRVPFEGYHNNVPEKSPSNDSIDNTSFQSRISANTPLLANDDAHESLHDEEDLDGSCSQNAQSYRRYQKFLQSPAESSASSFFEMRSQCTDQSLSPSSTPNYRQRVRRFDFTPGDSASKGLGGFMSLDASLSNKKLYLPQDEDLDLVGDAGPCDQRTSVALYQKSIPTQQSNNDVDRRPWLFDERQDIILPGGSKDAGSLEHSAPKTEKSGLGAILFGKYGSTSESTPVMAKEGGKRKRVGAAKYLLYEHSPMAVQVFATCVGAFPYSIGLHYLIGCVTTFYLFSLIQLQPPFSCPPACLAALCSILSVCKTIKDLCYGEVVHNMLSPCLVLFCDCCCVGLTILVWQQSKKIREAIALQKLAPVRRKRTERLWNENIAVKANICKLNAEIHRADTTTAFWGLLREADVVAKHEGIIGVQENANAAGVASLKDLVGLYDEGLSNNRTVHELMTGRIMSTIVKVASGTKSVKKGECECLRLAPSDVNHLAKRLSGIEFVDCDTDALSTTLEQHGYGLSGITEVFSLLRCMRVEVNPAGPAENEKTIDLNCPLFHFSFYEI